MIRLHEGSGSSEIELLDAVFTQAEWSKLRTVAIRLLERRGHFPASEFLSQHPFGLFHGTNGFGDDFCVLYMQADMDTYVELAEMADDMQMRHSAKCAAEAVGEVSGQHVRFVAIDLLQATGPAAVAPPVLEITSDTVERALRDAERLLATEGATSGVDRIHTAFHGYLRALASRANLGHSDTAGVTELFRLIRAQHPSFATNAAHQAEIDKILRALANVVDTLNPLRNQGSVAHPNVDLLAEPEAMLFINSVRCLLHYMNAKTKM
jgi:Abortive infection C-terminus